MTPDLIPVLKKPKQNNTPSQKHCSIGIVSNSFISIITYTQDGWGRNSLYSTVALVTQRGHKDGLIDYLGETVEGKKPFNRVLGCIHRGIMS